MKKEIKRIGLLMSYVISLAFISIIKLDTNKKIHFYNVLNLSHDELIIVIINFLSNLVLIIVSMVLLRYITKVVTRLIRDDNLFNLIEEKYIEYFLIMLLGHVIIIYCYALLKIQVFYIGIIMFGIIGFLLSYIFFREIKKVKISKIIITLLPSLIYVLLDITVLAEQL